MLFYYYSSKGFPDFFGVRKIDDESGMAFCS